MDDPKAYAFKCKYNSDICESVGDFSENCNSANSQNISLYANYSSRQKSLIENILNKASADPSILGGVAL